MMKKKTKSLPGEGALPAFLAGDDKRSVILRAAHNLFLRDGFSATTMDAVTKEAGVSKPTVYAHFTSKAQLFEALIRQGSENALSEIIPPLTRTGRDPRIELTEFFEPLVGMIFSRSCAWHRLIISEAVRHPENAVLFYSCTIARVTKTVENYLTALAKEGSFEREHVANAANAIVSMVLLGPLHRALVIGPEAVDWGQLVHFGIELFLRFTKSR